MKKVLLTLCAAALCFTGMAQNKNIVCPRSSETFTAQSISKNATKDDVHIQWSHIHGNGFQTNDINGNPVNVADTLAAGKSIVIDYSATWCPPCFRFHNSKVLEAIHEQMPNVCVLWVEADPSTTLADIQGTGSNTQGDWTHYSDGSEVSYRIIDCADCESMIDPTGYVPAIYFISPEGYYCHIYGEEWGVYIDQPAQLAVANITALIEASPQAGQAPVISIDGPLSVLKGNVATFTALITSVDEVTNISWTIDGGNPATASSETVSTTWNTLGDHTVTLSVTNTTGTTTKSINVNVFSWNWDNTMTYVTQDEYLSSVGVGGGAFYWGAMYPAQFMSGRNFIKSVDIYVSYSGTYKLLIGQGGDNAPASQLYTKTVQFTSDQENTWQKINVSGSVSLNGSNLWVYFYTTNIGYPAAGAPFCGDLNGSLVSMDGTQWMDVQSASGGSLDYTWMIKATTGDQGNADIEDALGSKLYVYPNPTTGMITIDVDNFVNCDITDVAGHTVMTSNESTIDMSNLSNGVYFVRVNTTNGSAIQKIVKK